ncbi:hypothetical protein EST38_g5600 [Candolleomyces aberdarensis]|uniref:Uncharacterized protein n=1 Tax=Candolleomyces aberdarensis TaxID=2316362 RepID=A0A4Q2DK03_9AGAR|nr:hypothetical protein EST38_g5600 [Candolleomyces aberdarensis]
MPFSLTYSQRTGWEHEFDTMGIANSKVPNAELCYLGYLQKTEELTEQEWKDTKDDWIIFMQGVKNIHERNARCLQFEARVRTHIAPAYTQYVLSQPFNAVVPTLAEVVQMEEFLSIAAGPPFDQSLPDGVFDGAVARLPELVGKWQSEREEIVLQALRNTPVHAPGKEVQRNLLSYASTLFSCRKCGRAVAYPTLFVHECFLQLLSHSASTKRVSKKSRRKDEKEEGNTGPPAPEGGLSREALDEMVQLTFPRARSWHPGSNLVFNGPGYHHTVVVLDLLGLERTTTAEELRKLDPYLECRCGCFKERKSETMSWMQVIQYCKRHRLNSYEGSFAVVDKPGAGTRQQVTKYKPICSWCQPRNMLDDPTQDPTQHYIDEHWCTQAEAQAFDSRALKEELAD